MGNPRSVTVASQAKEEDTMSSIRSTFLVGICIFSAGILPPAAFAQLNDQEVLKELMGETPAATEVVNAALRHSELFRSGPGRWASRSRTKAVLPVFEIGLSRDLGEAQTSGTSRTLFGSASVEVAPGSFGNIIEGPDDESESLTRDEDLSLRLSAKWALNELVFNSDELRASREAQNLVDLRSSLTRRVLDLYYERLSALLELRMPLGFGAHQKIERRLKADQATSELDSLTGGYFSSEIKAREQRVKMLDQGSTIP